MHVYTSDSDLVVTESSEMNDRLEPNTCDADKENAPSPTNDDNKSVLATQSADWPRSIRIMKKKPELRRV